MEMIDKTPHTWAGEQSHMLDPANTYTGCGETYGHLFQGFSTALCRIEMVFSPCKGVGAACYWSFGK